MIVRILRGTVAEGRPLTVGDVINLAPNEAQYLIALGKAEQMDVAAAIVADPAAVHKTAERKAPLKRGR